MNVSIIRMFHKSSVILHMISMVGKGFTECVYAHHKRILHDAAVIYDLVVIVHFYRLNKSDGFSSFVVGDVRCSGGFALNGKLHKI